MKNVKRIGNRIKTFVVDLLEKEKYSRLDKFFLKGLLYLSIAFRILTKFRRKLNSLGLIKSKKPPIPTICIGNIVAGGSGKTPTIIELTALLAKKYKVGVISKGYLGTKVKKNMVREIKETDSAKFFGDEPVMIKSKCPDSAVLVSKSRLNSLKMAHEMGCDVALVDDGFQDMSFSADLDVVLVKSLDAIEKGYFLPRGYLRDDPKILDKAHYVALSGNTTKVGFENETKYLDNFTSARKFGISPRNFKIKGNSELKLDKINNEKIGVFSAIANSNSFEMSLNNLGSKIIDRFHLLDHSSFDMRELLRFIRRCKEKGASYVFCTMKDYVKLPKVLKAELPIFYLDYSFEVSYQRNEFSELLLDIDRVIERHNTKREISL